MLSFFFLIGWEYFEELEISSGSGCGENKCSVGSIDIVLEQN